ncbi:MAG: PaaI family thioesterase [Chitinophagaceae bacterium]|nr:MAG: PaaI family thioesterase [Chitinophagaceae bacterium]
MEHLGIEYTIAEEGYLEATMPVDKRTHQPMGLLHGGASAALAESLGSAGSTMLVNLEEYEIRGVELNINHLRGVREGRVTGKATIVHQGRTTHIWDIKIEDDEQNLVAVSRLTIIVLPRRK